MPPLERPDLDAGIRLYREERAELTLALASSSTAERCRNRIRNGSDFLSVVKTRLKIRMKALFNCKNF
jgi:hypothetical protein